MQPTDTYTVNIPEGTVYVLIQAADRKPSGPRGVEEVRPRVEITTDVPAPDAARHDWEYRYLTVRGRQYRIQKTYFRAHGEWEAEPSPHNGGFRRENGAQVPFHTPTWDLLYNIVSDVLAQFRQARPGWERESERLGLLADRHLWEVEAAKARQDAADAENEIARLDAQLLMMD